MNRVEALIALLDGEKVTCKEWGNSYVFIKDDEIFTFDEGHGSIIKPLAVFHHRPYEIYHEPMNICEAAKKYKKIRRPAFGEGWFIEKNMDDINFHMKWSNGKRFFPPYEDLIATDWMEYKEKE